MTEEQTKIKVGDRVVDRNTDERGKVSRISADGDCIQVKWDGGMQKMMEVKDLKRLE